MSLDPILSWARGLVVLVAVTACSSPSDDAGEGGDASVDDAHAPRADAALEENRPVNLTLWPTWEIPLGPDGFGQPIPMGGVKLCVVKQRPYGASLESFTTVDWPCVTTEEGVKPVLRVPGSSEIVVTATKPGYQAVAYSVVTWHVDLDITSGPGAVDVQFFGLMRDESPLPWKASGETGSLIVYTYACGIGWTPQCGFIGGAAVSLKEPAGEGPTYLRDGIATPGATATQEGRDQAASGAAFTNLPPREYLVTVDRPGAYCPISGGAGAPVYGFPGEGGTIRAAVLAGHASPVSAICTCLDPADTSCGWDGAGDAGAPAPQD